MGTSAFGGVGFRLAGGKTVTMSADAMSRGLAFFKDLEDENVEHADLAVTKRHLAETVRVQNHSDGLGFQSANKSSSDFKTPDASVGHKKVDNSDSTPKLPAEAKFPIGRRRLADTSSEPVSVTSAKKKRMDIFSRLDAMDKEASPKPVPGFSSAAPALLAQLPKGRPYFQYSSQNGKKTTPLVLFPTTAVTTEPPNDSRKPASIVQDVDGALLTLGDVERESCQPRKVELGKLVRQRTDGTAQRTTLSSALAGQTPRIYDIEDYERYGVIKQTLEVNSQNAQTFCFTKEYFATGPSEGSDHLSFVVGDGAKVERDEAGTISSEEFVKAFMTSALVDPKLVSMAWCLNHYRWIVWKEAAMEAGFPHLFGGKLLTPDRVMLQLKYRYDCEVEKAQRSCLKQILNGDGSTYRPMVLCVSAILLNRDVDALVEVADGWYSVKARLDVPLSQRLARGQIIVGQKLFISRCAISGVESGFEPLEAPPNVQLVLTANTVRRARWSAMLGFQSSKGGTRFSLSSLVIGGGMVASVEVLVQRIHPILYMVKNSTGRTLIMDEKAEARDARIFQEHYDRCLEKLVEEIEKSLMKEVDDAANEGDAKTDASGHKLVPRTQEIRAICDVEELYRMITKSADPDAVADSVTPTQRERLKTFCAKVNDQQAHRFHDKLEKAIREKAVQLPQRRVTPFLKMRVAGCHPNDVDKKVAPILTIWKPDDDTLYHVKIGVAYMLTNVQVSQSNASWDTCKFALSTTTETRFIPLQKKTFPADK